MMKLSKFNCLVFFHFALFFFSPGKTECNTASSYMEDLHFYDAPQSISIDSVCNGTLGPNLLAIGDFGSDTANVVMNDPNITLGYDYQNGPPPDDGTYTITNNISDWGSFAELFWINIEDNSPDPDGYMMVVNAHFEPGNFYKELISVCPNTNYVFSADLINLTKSNIPNFILPSVDFLLNGTAVSSVNDIPQDEQWHTSQFSYTTGPDETFLFFIIRNSAPGGFGNDLALDNIFMKACNGQVAVTQHGDLCEDAYLRATPYNVPDDFIPHFQWQYLVESDTLWQDIEATESILPLNNLPSDASYRCLLAGGATSFGLSSCYGISNEIDILFPSLLTEVNPIICENEFHTINGSDFNISGIYTDTLTSFFGCDSIVITDLEVLQISTLEETVYICEGETYDFQGTDISVANIYEETLTNAVGCDSIITLDLIVLEHSEYTFEEVICDTETYTFNNQSLTTSGIYNQTLTSFNGCDSLVELQLTVHTSYESFIEETICYGEHYTFNGDDQTVSGDYDMSLTTINGCDSIIHLSLNVLGKKEADIVRATCGGQDFVYNNISYSTTGIYVDTLIAEFGCDSIITLDLVFETAINVSIEENICNNESYIFNGIELDAQGVYIDTLQNYEGCDSIVTLNLTKFQSTESFQEKSICEDEVYEFGGQQLTSSGAYEDSLTNEHGCDSIVYLNFTVFPKYEMELPVFICHEEVYEHNGDEYSATGTYPIQLNSINGCDSIVYLQLTVAEENVTMLQDEICAGEAYEMGGDMYTESGNYQTNLIAHSGCDSIVVLSLSVNQSESTQLDINICEGETYQIGSTNYAESGMYTIMLTTQYGCDSIVTLDLMVNQSESFETLTFCNGESYNGNYADTTITIIETSYLGCDSIAQLQLIFHQMDELEITGDPVFCEGENRILSVNDYDTYLWSNGATTPEIEITESGVYEVTVWTANGCSSTKSIDVEKRNLDAEITFKNPSCNNSNGGSIQIEDVFGSGGNYQYSIDGEEFTTGTVFWNLTGGEYEVVVRDEVGCDFKQLIQLEDPVDFDISVGEDKMLSYGDSTEITVSTGAEIGIDSFYWYPQVGLSCLDCLTPFASPLTSTVYTLTIITDQGCTIEDKIHINVFKEKDVYVPNVFSPNGDGENDLFTIYGGVMVERIIQVEIYDRWGEHVFSETPNSLDMNGWDGTFNNQNLKQGVYVYYARIGYIDGDEIVIRGDITLVR